MSLLLPLGLLGLLSLLVLLIIYIIKPNYQQKLLSSTFVWKLSLKYQKKRIPVSKLRNLLILLCQILIFVLLALILTQPSVLDKGKLRDNEKVIIIDASASMLATAQYDSNKYTRFDQAVNDVIDIAETTFDKGGTLTIIIAGEKARFLSDKYPDDASTETVGDNTDGDSVVRFYRVGAESQDIVLSKLEELKTERDKHGNPAYCTYGAADIEGAMNMAEVVTISNPRAEVLLYTGKQYLNNNGVTVKNMSRGAEEVNVAVLDLRAVLEEGYYTFYADVVSYGENSEVDVEFLIDVNVYDGLDYVDSVHETFHRLLREGEVTTVIFDTNSPKRADGSTKPVTDYVFEFKSASASVKVADSIAEDNIVTLYGGVKPTLKVQYASTKPNKFFSSALMTIGDALRNRWDIDIDEVRGTSAVPQLSGYDLYIFEHRMPASMPNDGVVFLVNPAVLPSELGVMLGSGVTDTKLNLTAPEIHPLVNYMNVANLIVTSHNPINTYPEGFTTVMQCDGKPVFICKNTADEKIAIMTFSVNYSDIAVSAEFPTLIYNLFEYFIPSTFTQYIFDVNDNITLNARGSSLELGSAELKETFTVFPAEYHLTQVGAYTTSQLLFGKTNEIITESFYVKMPAEESNIFSVVDLMPGSVVKAIPPTTFDDLLVYFAAALVLLLFVEWWLHSRSRI